MGAAGVILKLLYHALSFGFFYLSNAEVAVSHCMVLLSGADFLVGKKLLLPSFRDCLKERGTVQMLTVGREAAIEVQVCFQNIN